MNKSRNSAEPTSIAVLNFLPDVGHVMPLLRIAEMFRDRGFEVTCYLPEECADLARARSFDFVSIGQVLADEEERPVFDILSQRSIFHNAFSRSKELRFDYWLPIKDAVARQIEFISARLRDQRPDLMLSDKHIFRPWYEKLSAELGIPLVISDYEGSHRDCQRKYVQVYGITRRHVAVQRSVEVAGKLCQKWYRYWNALVRFYQWRSAKKKYGSMDGERQFSPKVHARLLDTALRPLVIRSGFGVLEKKYLGGVISLGNEDDVFFPPISALGDRTMPRGLGEWLEESPHEAIVYVSFGTRVAVTGPFVETMMNGLERINGRILWAMPMAPKKFSTRYRNTSQVRIETFVPQPEILAMPNVRCCITHGGAGTVQECLISGTPMLCIPYMWDQPYNASIVEELGVGKKLWRKQVNAPSIAEAVHELIDEEHYGKRARQFSEELRQEQSALSVIDRVRDFVRAWNEEYHAFAIDNDRERPIPCQPRP